MAKQSKKSKTTSVSAQSNFLSKLLPRTKKAQLLSFLIVFALIGGGIMAYQSFTSVTVNTIGYGVDQLEKKDGNVVVMTESKSGGAKAGTKVLALTSTRAASSSIQVKNSARKTIKNSHVRSCANVAVDGDPSRFAGVYISVFIDHGDYTKNYGIKTYEIKGSQYRKLCSDYMTIGGEGAKIGGHLINFKSVHSTSLRLKVGSMSTEYMLGGGK